MPIDPVCNMQVETSTPWTAEREGETFYFCCRGCRAKFLGEVTDARGSCCGSEKPPAELVTLSVARPARTASTIYTCGCHPEIEQDQPGVCPKCGMALEPKFVTTEPPQQDDELQDMTRRFRVALALGVPIFLLAMLPMLGVPLDPWISTATNHWMQFALSIPVVLWAGWPLLTRGWRSVVTWNLNMFSLIALGVGAAFGYSAVAMLFPSWIPASFRHHGTAEVYFEAAAMIVALVLLGQILEGTARRRTGSAIRELLSLAPSVAHRVRDGEEHDAPLEQVQAGDTLRIRPGEKVPVDGTIIEGKSTVNEAMITGEANPNEKAAGDQVIGGTVNQQGSFLMRAEKVGQETVLAQIVSMVGHAQRTRAPIQRVADSVAGYFVPAVVLAAVLTFMVWAVLRPQEPALAYALVNAVAVLIVACPCALGLATPMSIMVGVGRGAKEGVLIKEAQALETLEKVDTLIVDKTGTLTEGRPKLTACLPAEGFSEDQLLAWAASAEQNSEHSIARSTIGAAIEKEIELLPVEAFESITGSGVQSTVDGRTVLVGRRAWLEELGVENTDSMDEQVGSLSDQGATIVHVAAAGRYAGAVAVSDPIKQTTPAAVKALHEMGLRIIMVTGDGEKTARAVADQLGIDQYEAAVKPQQKHARVEQLKAQGKRVAMAGDGINDAPALAAADVGIAMGNGTDVAIEAAGVTLVKGDLQGIVRAIELSHRVMRNIRQNLFFAFFYNGLGVPIAAGALYPVLGTLLNPMIAAAAMSLSSVSVIGNALRLRRQQ